MSGFEAHARITNSFSGLTPGHMQSGRKGSLPDNGGIVLSFDKISTQRREGMPVIEGVTESVSAGLGHRTVGPRFLHSVHGNRRNMRQFLQPLAHTKQFLPSIPTEEGARASLQHERGSTFSHGASQHLAGSMRATRAIKPQINLNRKSEVYHTRRNMELLKLCEQPDLFLAPKDSSVTAGNDALRVHVVDQRGGDKAEQGQGHIFSVQMQSFDKTFEEGFNSYLKIGEQAVSVNDVNMKQNETYVDHG